MERIGKAGSGCNSAYDHDTSHASKEAPQLNLREFGPIRVAEMPEGLDWEGPMRVAEMPEGLDWEGPVGPWLSQ